MSDYHVMEMDNKVDSALVAFHFTVPDENNFAGRNKRTVVQEFLEKESETGTITSQYPFIGAPELADMQVGIVYEHVQDVKFDGNLTKLQKRNIIDSKWTSLNTSILNKLNNVLDFYGYDRDVP